jgi:glucosamine-6-phosphate deaminase
MKQGTNMTRKQEISELLRLPSIKVQEKAGGHLRCFEDCDGIHWQIAADMLDFIKAQNDKGEKTRFILPVGPVGQYPFFLAAVNRQRISLKNCYFFYMDENADNSGYVLPPEHPLSFQGEMRKLWLDKVDPELAIPEEQLFFPSERNIHLLAEKIEEVGDIDICFGGIGIHGHIAFNEPEPEVRESDPRLVYLNDFTTTINAIRAKVGGNLEGFPRKAYTLGLRQILGARQIRLACRNGIALDWANTVLRLALFGKPGDDYPCTYVNQRPDFIIYTDKDTLKQPEVIL